MADKYIKRQKESDLMQQLHEKECSAHTLLHKRIKKSFLILTHSTFLTETHCLIRKVVIA